MQTLRGNWGLASSAQNKAFGRGERLDEDAEGNAGASQPPEENLSQISVLLLLRPGAALDLSLPFLDRGEMGEDGVRPNQPRRRERGRLLSLPKLNKPNCWG